MVQEIIDNLIMCQVSSKKKKNVADSHYHALTNLFAILRVRNTFEYLLFDRRKVNRTSRIVSAAPDTRDLKHIM